MIFPELTGGLLTISVLGAYTHRRARQMEPNGASFDWLSSIHSPALDRCAIFMRARALTCMYSPPPDRLTRAKIRRDFPNSPLDGTVYHNKTINNWKIVIYNIFRSRQYNSALALFLSCSVHLFIISVYQ